MILNAQFHNIVVFGRQAEIVNQYLAKGSLVLIGADKSNPKAVLSCRLDSSSLQDTAFVRQLKVTTDFVYREFVTTKVTIKNVQ